MSLVSLFSRKQGLGIAIHSKPIFINQYVVLYPVGIGEVNYIALGIIPSSWGRPPRATAAAEGPGVCLEA